jgi:hypothetical protein
VDLFTDFEISEKIKRKRNDKKTAKTLIKKGFENFPVELILKDILYFV